MSQQKIEMILVRQLSSYMAMPLFIVAPEGILVFYNEPAEMILGRRFEETGAMHMEEWSTIFKPTDAHGVPIMPTELPLAITDQAAASTPSLLDPWPGYGAPPDRGNIAATHRPGRSLPGSGGDILGG